MLLALRGASYHQGRDYVKEHVGRVVSGAIVCRRVLPATTMSVLAMPI